MFLHVPAFALPQGTLSYLSPLTIPNPALFHGKRAMDRELLLAGRAEGPTSPPYSQNPGLENKHASRSAAEPGLREHHIPWPEEMSHPIIPLWLPEGCVGSTLGGTQLPS